MFTDEDIDALRVKHGRVKHVVGDGDEWAVVLAPPKQADVKLYKHQLHDPAVRADAQETLFKKIAVACCIGDKECPVAEFLESYPMAPEGCSESISQLLGMSATARGKQ